MMQAAPDIRRWVLAGGCFAVPLFFLRFVNDPINVPKIAVLALVVSLALALRLVEIANGSSVKHLRPLLVPIGALLIPLLASWIFSSYRGWSLMGYYPRYLGLLPYLLTILLAILVADAFRAKPEPVLWALFAAGGIAGAYALIQVIGLDPLTWASRGAEAEGATSTLGNTNFTGAFLAMILPLGVALWLRDPSRRLLIGGVEAVCLAGLLASQSQGAYAAATAGLIVVGAFTVTRRAVRIAGLAVAGCIAAVLVLGVALSSSFGLSETLQRRAQWWKAAVAVAADSPVLGQGPNSFALEHSRVRSVQDVRETGMTVELDPHSVPLAFASSAGALGLAGLLFFLSVLYRRGYESAIEGVLPAALLGGITAYVVQSLGSVDTVSLRTSFYALAGALFASAMPEEVVSRRDKKRRSKKMAPAKGATPSFLMLLVPIAIVLAAWGTWWSFRLVVADARYAGALVDESGDFAETQADYEAAFSLRGDPVYKRSFASLLTGVAAQVASQGGAEEAQTLMDKGEELYFATSAVPDVRAVVERARLVTRWALEVPESEADALALYDDALELDPNNFLIYAEAGDAAVSFEEFESATEYFTAGIDLSESATDLAKLSAAYAHLGDLDAAREALARAETLDPTAAPIQEAQELIDAADQGATDQ